MSGGLLDERSVLIQPSLVRAAGSMSAAAVLQQIHWHARAGHVKEHAGHLWVVRSLDGIADEIGLTPRQVRTAITKLRTLRFVAALQPDGYDRTTWYRVLREAVDAAVTDLSKCQNGRLEATDRSVPSDQKVTCSFTETENSPEGRESELTLVSPAPAEESDHQRLMAGWIKDWRVVHQRDPSPRLRPRAGRAIRVALEDGEDPRNIAICLGVLAREGRPPNPENLTLVLGDMQAGRPRRKQAT